MNPKLSPYMELFKRTKYWTMAEQQKIYEIITSEKNKRGGSS